MDDIRAEINGPSWWRKLQGIWPVGLSGGGGGDGVVNGWRESLAWYHPLSILAKHVRFYTCLSFDRSSPLKFRGSYRIVIGIDVFLLFSIGAWCIPSLYHPSSQNQESHPLESIKYQPTLFHHWFYFHFPYGSQNKWRNFYSLFPNLITHCVHHQNEGANRLNVIQQKKH